MKTQYHLQSEVVFLEVKKASIYLRAILYILAILCILLPLAGIIASLIVHEGGLSILNVMLFLFLLFLGLFVFRLALWNTYGKEEVYFGSDVIYYQAHYGWFKDKRKKFEVGNYVEFEIKSVGYAEENVGVLVVKSRDNVLSSAVKVPIDQLQELVVELKRLY